MRGALLVLFCLLGTATGFWNAGVVRPPSLPSPHSSRRAPAGVADVGRGCAATRTVALAVLEATQGGGTGRRLTQLCSTAAPEEAVGPQQPEPASDEPVVSEKPKEPQEQHHWDSVEAYVEQTARWYDGYGGFLKGPTERTLKLRSKCEQLLAQEQDKGGVLSVDGQNPSRITAFPPGYLDEGLEIVVGLQTDQPLKRAMKPAGGLRVVEAALKAAGAELDEGVRAIFRDFRKTHNEGVFDCYTDDMRAARRSKLLTGLPDAYGRGRIIGDYRRLALFGADELIARKREDLAPGGVLDRPGGPGMDEETIRLRQEVSEQIKALLELEAMAADYGFDVGRPVRDAREAVQWLYFAYLGAIKEQDGAAMSLGRVDAFLDTYFEKDIREGRLDEEGAQELVDDLVLHLRMARHLRTPEYNELFAGDPTWITAVLGGMGDDQGHHRVTKTSFRLLQTLVNLGHAPEPNLTVLWSDRLPRGWKEFCARVSLDSCALQFVNDEAMRPLFGTDYGISCCVSPMSLGRQMQYFGARANLPKLLLYALNQGRDEITGEQVGPRLKAVSGGEEQPLRFDEVMDRFDQYLDWMARLYAKIMNIIHCQHDKYCYERLQMAFHDTEVERLMAFGASGISIVADSLSAIKHAHVYPVRNEEGITTAFNIQGDYPQFGNDDDSVDDLARDIVHRFVQKLRAQTIYRGARPTLSLLTITSNIVYGKATGSTPDGRQAGEPFAPGANPMHGRDKRGAIGSLNSVAKLPFSDCLDGISNTFSIAPHALGPDSQTRQSNLEALLDGYFNRSAHRGQHLNVNCIGREVLEDAMHHPERYPQLTIRVSGYAVHFTKLTRDQQREVIARTFHAQL